MPVQIPTLNRTQPVESPERGRIRTQSIDVQGPGRQITNATNSLVDEVVDVYTKAEADAYNSQISELAHQLDRFGRRRLDGDPDKPGTGLRHLQGNPEEPYSKFDDELGAKRDELLASSGLSGKYLEKAKGALNSRYNTLYNNSLTYYGLQKTKYKKQLADTTVGISQRDALNGVGFYRSGDDASLEPFNQALDSIRTARIEEAVSVGTAQIVNENAEGEKYRTLDDEGNVQYVKLGESVKYQIAKDLSKTTYESINATVATGRVSEAKDLMKRFGGQLDGVSKAKLTEALEDKEVEQKAYGMLSKLDDKPYDQRAAALKSFKTRNAQDAKAKLKARQLLNEDSRYRAQEKKRASTEVYNQIVSQVEPLLDPARAGNALVDSTIALENTVVEVNGVRAPVKEIVNKVTDATQRKALFKMVQDRSDTVGDDQAFAELMDDSRPGGAMYGMSFATLQQRAATTSKSQYKTAEGIWKRLNTESDPEMRSRYGSGMSKVIKHAENLGLIKKSRRTKTWTKKSQETIDALTQDYLRESYNITKGTTPQQIESMARKLVIEKKREMNADEGGGFFDTFKGFFSDDKAQPAPPSETSNAPKGGFDSLSDQEMLKAIDNYKKANPNDTPSIENVRKFYEETNNAAE